MPIVTPSARVCLTGVLASALVSVPAASVRAQSSPRTLSVEVTVVDRDGQPMPALTADKFEVEIAGRRRKVLSATFHKADPKADAAAPEAAPTFVIAIDALTFGQGGAKSVAAVVRAFVESLPAGSRVGLSTVPSGPSVEVTDDRAAVAAALGTLTGHWQPAGATGTFGVRAADVIEYFAAGDRTPIIQSFCTGAVAGTGEEDGCAGLLDQEMASVVNALETQARASLGMLGGLASRMSKVPGRKVLVLVTGGVAAADRSGGRPDVGNVPAAIAEEAARSEIAVYTLLLDRRLLDADAIATRGRQASPAREAEVLGRWVEQFSASVGGASFRVQGAASDPSHTRLVRETSGRYVLVVEATDADRPGTVPRLRVRVDQRGALVRSRTGLAIR
jgi:VWFA-related protein